MTREMTEMKRDIQILQNNGQSDMFTDSNSPADITLSVIGSGTMVGSGYHNISIQPLTSNDILSLGTSDLSTITLTNGVT
jgi:hypothetical protein